jgi:hypothetical protein
MHRHRRLSPDRLSPDRLSPDRLSPDRLSPDRLGRDQLVRWGLGLVLLGPGGLGRDRPGGTGCG